MTLKISDLPTVPPSTVYEAGCEAARAGEPVSAAPYKPGTSHHTEWAAGWMSQRKSDLQASGQMHIDTMGMKARVAADMAHLPEYRSDPVAEILGLSPGVELAGVMQRMADDFREIFGSYAANFAQVAAAIRSIADNLNDTSLHSDLKLELTALKDVNTGS